MNKAETWDIDSLLGVDSETCLIRPGLPAPPVVCTAFGMSGIPFMLTTSDPEHWALLIDWFENNRVTIVGHNFAYDVCCYMAWCPPELNERLRLAIFSAYEDDRVVDTMVAERIIQIERGKDGPLGLAPVSLEYGLHVEKEVEGPDGEIVRTGYGKLLGKPLSEYPEQYKAYALGDPVATRNLMIAQIKTGLIARADVAMLTRDALSLALTAAAGLTPNEAGINSFRETAQARLAELQQSMIDSGFMRWQRGKAQPVKNTKVIAAAIAKDLDIAIDDKGNVLAQGKELDRLKALKVATDKGKVGYGAKALRLCTDQALLDMADYGEWATAWNGPLKTFQYCLDHDLPIGTRFGFTATTRTKSSGSGKGQPPTATNQQNLKAPKDEHDPLRLRPCIKARNGAFVFSDYSGLENGTLAQVIFDRLGRGKMAEKISDGWDYHCEMAGEILGGVSHDEVKDRIANGDKGAKLVRQTAKPFNFGLPGYMKKATTVMGYCRGYGVQISVDECQRIIDLWWATQHEQVAYLTEYIESLKQGFGFGATYNVPIPRTGITRRGAARTEAANCPFQGLGARCALRGLWYVVREQTLGRAPGRACAFIHDEIGSDCRPDEVAAVEKLHVWGMIKAAEEYLPDVKMQVESAAGSVWSKNTRTVRDSDGNLQMDPSV